MKNLNPTSGLRQIVSGYLYLPRQIIIDYVKTKKIKPSELGYFIIFLISADWDKNEYRKGFIRFKLKELAVIWNISYSTLYSNIKKLFGKELLFKEKDTLKIKDFDLFIKKGAEHLVKNKITDLEIKKLFPDSIGRFHNFENSETKNSISFKSSSKVGFNTYPKGVCIKQSVRTKESYEQIYKNGGFLSLTPDDMQWIDENIEEIIEIDSKEMEKNIIEMYFNGDRDKYKNSLVS